MNDPRANGIPAPQAGAVNPAPKGYSIDVRLFLAIITTTMAIAFSAGVMFGPTDPALVGPVLSRMGIRIDLPTPMSEGGGGRSAVYPPPQLSSMAGMGSLNNAAATGGHGTSKKAKAVQITPDGNVLRDAEGNVILRQPRRLPTDHVATLGYKIKETHVNIEQPVHEGTGDKIPIQKRDISYDNKNGTGGTLLRDQTMPSGQHRLVDI